MYIHKVYTLVDESAIPYVESPRACYHLGYTLGKLEILKLREDYKNKMGANFSLEDFHSKFLQQGFPPVKLIRRAMLGDDSPAL